MSSDLPYFPDIGIISLVPNKWGGTWRRRHQTLTRLARYFHVVWCDPAPSWRRLRLPNSSRDRNENHGSVPAPGFIIYRPEKWLPAIGRPRFLARWTLRQRLLRARQILLNRGCRKIVLYIWRPEYEPALDLIDHDLSCYHVDDEYTFSEVERPISKREARLISCADQVIIHSTTLFEKKGKLNPRSLLVPNGVDYRSFATPCKEPVDLQPVPHPRMGYVGIIKGQLDLELLVALARRHSQWSFVMVGPQGNLGKQAAFAQELSRLPNVYFLGLKPVDALPAYVQHFDVGLLCYRVTDYTKFIYPLKMHEYLATGLPVVGSPIPSVLEFSDVVTIARTTDEWSTALKDSLAPAAGSAEHVEARRRVARRYDWDELVGTIAKSLCDRLGPPYLDQFMRIMAGAHVAPSATELLEHR
jgi:glycosyltransferase involved in cell wall biosynthesis